MPRCRQLAWVPPSTSGSFLCIGLGYDPRLSMPQSQACSLHGPLSPLVVVTIPMRATATSLLGRARANNVMGSEDGARKHRTEMEMKKDSLGSSLSQSLRFSASQHAAAGPFDVASAACADISTLSIPLSSATKMFTLPPRLATSLPRPMLAPDARPGKRQITSSSVEETPAWWTTQRKIPERMSLRKVGAVGPP
jgi:hypothetical protein